jgi:hypothetical protein
MKIPLLDVGLKLLDKLIKDPEQLAKAKFDLVELQQSGAIKELEAELADVASAREHDKASYGNSAVDFLRGIVRPVITLSAFSFYVYAKVEAVGLTAEDYGIIGMVLAFWFGGKFIGKDVQK